MFRVHFFSELLIEFMSRQNFTCKGRKILHWHRGFPPGFQKILSELLILQ
ncbi:hypothetical protein LEP1GSC171_3797 [Leptospira santarosai str. HAI1380]|uniref:Uncharacterized protein n=1 Tax=Leptospira santarosai str. ZUN179 TaxID=1049985 RepID=M6UGZ8_9LEPT|nr:hypothetical protein LEP1GSC068_3344 [Leptospira sp. Fiocruz LV3954]EMM76126.1 hypothetical protein LEP1GSC040_3537 [Leptospira santarosai str. 2000030832]EMM87500.1 hypothetical protein LEP1GSC039_2368 [Leptospira santarosai str. 2000027870]EMO44402.1 hypothetical protein LEP1GSC187_3781 [Leptospira santarosai str. ZUN179]EMO86195.1 hypothetical protein LEP1GSC070_2946 [Leptospira santarosai str. AIM]EMP01490.1 hypothetical protein LEP1GSC171_3797 [Leptospira santarosai str. HAI1380]